MKINLGKSKVVI